MSYTLAVNVRALEVERVSPAEDAAAPHAADQPSNSGPEEDQVAFTAGNPRVEHITGVVHLYRDVPADSVVAAQPSGSDAAAPAAQAAEQRGDRLAVLAIPADLGVADFCAFLGGYLRAVREMRLVRREDARGVCLVLLRFCDAETAAGFYDNYNGRPFSSLEPEITCRLVYVKDVQISGGGALADAAAPQQQQQQQQQPSAKAGANQRELPTCPVCLERLDEPTSGVVTTVCNHKFHSECLKGWGDTSCPVCRYCHETSAAQSHCQVCGRASDVWICLICGHLGCGRYHAKHAVDHWKETNHCYALEIQTQRVWDYAGDGYVHRLIQSKTDGKLVEVAPPRADARADASCSRHEALEPGVEDALVASKLDALAAEYGHLLSSQLESQRAWYDARQAKAVAAAEAGQAEAATAAQRADAAAEAALGTAKDLERQKRAAERKLSDVTARLRDLKKERDVLDALNTQLRANQADLKAALAAGKQREQEQAAQLVDLQEQVRDLMMFIEAQRVVQSSGGADSELSNGTVLPMPEQQPEPQRGKRRTQRTASR